MFRACAVLNEMSSVRESICRAAQELGYPVLKPEQLDVLVNFVKGRDVFAVLPTGFGKSLLGLLTTCMGRVPQQRTWILHCCRCDSSSDNHERSGTIGCM